MLICWILYSNKNKLQHSWYAVLGNVVIKWLYISLGSVYIQVDCNLMESLKRRPLSIRKVFNCLIRSIPLAPCMLSKHYHVIAVRLSSLSFLLAQNLNNWEALAYWSITLVRETRLKASTSFFCSRQKILRKHLKHNAHNGTASVLV